VTPPEFVVGPGDLDDAAASGRLTLAGDEARHAVRVQRLRPGERVDVVDGAGIRVRGVIAQVSVKAAAPTLTLDVIEVRREANDACGIVLIQALAKGGRDEMAIEAATGLGVESIWPWASARSVVRWPGEKAARGRVRWEALVRAETKVARRAWLPTVMPLVTTAGLVEAMASGSLAGADVLVLHEDATTPLASEVRRRNPEWMCASDAGATPDASGVHLARPTARMTSGEDSPAPPVPFARPLALVVGPEGGIAPEELDALKAAGATPVLLGRAVLRASAAGPAALAALATLRGAWG
jgi:16S rRNA (uracil1498-N3)-methyltransferase